MANDDTMMIAVIGIIVAIVLSSLSAGLATWYFWDSLFESPSPSKSPAPVVVLAPYTADPSPSPESSPAPIPASEVYPFEGTEFKANFYTEGDEYQKNGSERIVGPATKEECAKIAKQKEKDMVWNMKTKECWAKYITQASIFVGQKIIESDEWISVTFDPYFKGKSLSSLK